MYFLPEGIEVPAWTATRYRYQFLNRRKHFKVADMCGILGIVAKPGAPEFRRIPAALNLIRHRGPDGMGFLSYTEGKVSVSSEFSTSEKTEAVLGHTRLNH